MGGDGNTSKLRHEKTKRNVLAFDQRCGLRRLILRKYKIEIVPTPLLLTMETNPPAGGANHPSAPIAQPGATTAKVVTMDKPAAVAPVAATQQQKPLEQPPPEKKQKTAETMDPNPPSTSATPSQQQHTTQLLLPDYPAIRQMVQDVLALLQTYGPLTLGQLEYNLPPITNTTNGSQPQWSVKDILTILTSIQLVQERTSATTADPQQQPQIPQQTVYYWNDGIPRINHLETASAVLQPPDIVPEIAAAVAEAEQAWERGNRLLALMQPATNDSQQQQPSHRDLLKQLLVEYPELVNDPVYLTAFRCCHIDVNTGKGGGSGKNPGGGKNSKGGGKTAGAGNSKQSKTKAAAAPKPAPVAPPVAAPSRPPAPAATNPPPTAPTATTTTTTPAAAAPTTNTVAATAAPAQPPKTGP